MSKPTPLRLAPLKSEAHITTKRLRTIARGKNFMNRRIDLWQFFRHLYRGGAYIVLGVMVSGVTWVNAAVQPKTAGVWLTTNHNGERRVALVIGNSKYAPELGKLKNPVNDATDVATTLRALGFEIIGGKAQLDVDLRQMDELVRAFGHKISGGGVGVFYFSGHGIQVNRVNYLLPLGARIEKERDVPFEAYNVERILRVRFKTPAEGSSSR
jgi:hypothetical protein